MKFTVGAKRNGGRMRVKKPSLMLILLALVAMLVVVLAVVGLAISDEISRPMSRANTGTAIATQPSPSSKPTRGLGETSERLASHGPRHFHPDIGTAQPTTDVSKPSGKESNRQSTPTSTIQTDSVQVEYFANGTIKKIANLKDGQLEGTVQEFWNLDKNARSSTMHAAS